MSLKIEKAMGVMGAILWVAAIFLRHTTLISYTATNFILGIIPNFGAVWILYCLILMAYQHTHQKLPKGYVRICITAAILIILLALEKINHEFFLAPFDIWDMIASCVASMLVLVCTAIRILWGRDKERKRYD